MCSPTHRSSPSLLHIKIPSSCKGRGDYLAVPPLLVHTPPVHNRARELSYYDNGVNPVCPTASSGIRLQGYLLSLHPCGLPPWSALWYGIMIYSSPSTPAAYSFYMHYPLYPVYWEIVNMRPILFPPHRSRTTAYTDSKP